MKLVIQRVSSAQVRVAGETVGRIGRGLLVFVAAEKGDRAMQAEEAARKVAGLRVFEDAAGKMNLGLSEVGRFRRSMGISVIGGLVSSTFLTLLVVPAAFEWLDRFRLWTRRLLGRPPTREIDAAR